MSQRKEGREEGTPAEKFKRRHTQTLLCLLGDVHVPGMFLDGDTFHITRGVTLKLKGYFSEAFLEGLGMGLYVPPARIRAHQLTRAADIRQVLQILPPGRVLLNLAHFRGYIPYFGKFARSFEHIQLPTRGKEIHLLAFAKRENGSTIYLLKMTYICGEINITTNGVQPSQRWPAGTHIISYTPNSERV